MNNNNPTNDGMKTGSQDIFKVTYNGETKTVPGANSDRDAARQAFGQQGADRATVEKIQTQKW